MAGPSSANASSDSRNTTTNTSYNNNRNLDYYNNRNQSYDNNNKNSKSNSSNDVRKDPRRINSRRDYQRKEDSRGDNSYKHITPRNDARRDIRERDRDQFTNVSQAKRQRTSVNHYNKTSYNRNLNDDRGGRYQLNNTRYNQHRNNGNNSYNIYNKRGSAPNSQYKQQHQNTGNNGNQNMIVLNRMKPTKWDITPPGFEKVPAERAKLSGLFPKPGEPRKLNHDLLNKILKENGMVGNRRIQILFDNSTNQNAYYSKFNNKLIISNLISNNQDELINLIRDLISPYETNSDSSLPSTEFNIFPQYNSNDNLFYLVITFSTAAAATITLATQSYFKSTYNYLSSSVWNRPAGYVQQLDPLDKLCGPNVIAIQDLSATTAGTEDDIRSYLKLFGIEANLIKSIYLNNNKTFTGCSLVEIPTNNNNSVTNVLSASIKENLSNLSWFELNKNTFDESRYQKVSDFNFQNLPKLVVDNTSTSSSNVLLLMNCVDPLDLKSDSFVEEIQATLKYSLENVSEIKIKKPDIDYRLNFDNISEGIGNIYIKFNSAEDATNAMNKISGKKFNDRTILCAYINERDFDMVGVLF
ncbi:hypothetical protein TBLA_0C01410 [Henningerozyma blattae CBS 6284]|uniref:RNA recognition motif domain-containing protein n=1 Tax=Henningerozyma blattae (strain ATCC 34711 / CBS 6284 / DSM 70876 / NBRC 10599 / NRRL Y-10934 / UCD 77-7) TaxID=1071380 RepID=I2H0Q4_HENB6|nr:hypothetical protein TBLA_0C01410 [Tetrapisispora blattae CBS 6284]CCH59956.1 hypothetical protein TBLA_0C01410 [Tetrapisispora blattae CBS 6284]